MRLIDAEALAEKIKEKINVLERDLLLDKGSWLSNIRLVWFKKLLIMVEALPTIEAKPVVHAHWVTDFDFDPEEEQELYFYFCSKCKDTLFGDKEDFKYCPYCGAQMDEVVVEENATTTGVKIPVISMEDVPKLAKEMEK